MAKYLRTDCLACQAISLVISIIFDLSRKTVIMYSNGRKSQVIGSKPHSYKTIWHYMGLDSMRHFDYDADTIQKGD